MNPTGNVTFLFTDIEGSTKLAQDYPEKLHAALEKHNGILRNAVESNNGRVFKIVGDAYCCAFQNAEDAVKAAVEIQIDLAKEKWDEAVIKVRIGIHSGNAEWNGNDYMGYITLARVARVMSAAYGEQILISNDTYKLFSHHSHHKGTKTQSENESASLCLSDLVVKDVCFRDLGERRLKDVIEPIRLYQVESEGLKKEFPPLKTLDARPNNLPIQLTNFIGREHEIQHVKELLKNNRLLTLTGTGGAGKTRFSLQTGADLIDDFANGVWIAELAALSDPAFLPDTILNAFGLKEEPKKTPEETLTDHLKDKEILIILDNCEHLIHECAEMAERLLLQCPKVKIIVTSREALNITGEQIYRIPPLSHPDPNSKDTPEQLTEYESVRLFIERAISVNPNFRINNENAPALAKVCSRLEGIPLAIELAAARTKVLSVEKIHERLDDRFNLLTGGKRTALPRQQTLRALIDWSYDLLSEKEKILWSRLTVFKSGWTLEAAEEVCSDDKISKNEILDLLSQLTEKSIIIYDESKGRYGILESIKQYGREKLPDGDDIFLKHLNYFFVLSENAETELLGEFEKKLHDILEADHNNIQSAIEWGVSNKNIEKASLAAEALGKFWDVRGYYSTGIKLFEIILDRSDELSKSAKSKMLNWKGIYIKNQGDYEQAQKYYEESLVLRRELEDKSGIAESLNGLGNVANYRGDYEQAEKFSEESLMLRRELGDKKGISSSLNGLGNIYYSRGDSEKAQKYYEESLVLRRELGDKQGIAYSLNNLGNAAHVLGDYEQVQKYQEESLELRREIGDKRGIAYSLNGLGYVAFIRGNYEKAQKYLEESLELHMELGDKHGIASTLIGLGNVAYSIVEYDKAQNYYEKCLELCRKMGDKRGIAYSLDGLGIVAHSCGNNEEALKYYEESLVLRREMGDKRGIAYSLNDLGNVDFSRGDYKQAQKYLEESLKLFRETGDKSGIASTLINFSGMFLINKDYYSGVKLISAVEIALESMGVALQKNDQKKKEEYSAKLHEQLSNEEYDKYREEGKKITLDEAVQLIVNS